MLSAIASRGSLIGNYAGILPTPSDYEEMTNSLKELRAKLGKIVSIDDLDLNNKTWYSSLDGTMLVAVYPWPVDLKGSDGRILVQAKWIGIQWDRSEGKPNRLLYGSEVYTIEGGFELPEDLTALQQSMPLP